MRSNEPVVDFERLLAFRTALRRFLRWSEQEALAAGLTSAHYQLLVAVKGLGDLEPTVGQIAEQLLLRHHSAGELIHRAQGAGLVVARSDRHDHRVVRVSLTTRGETILRTLAPRHIEEIHRLAPLAGQLGANDAIRGATVDDPPQGPATVTTRERPST